MRKYLNYLNLDIILILWFAFLFVRYLSVDKLISLVALFCLLLVVVINKIK